MNFLKTSLATELPVSYSYEGEGEKRHLLVLHGYSDNARSARKRMLGTAPVPGFSVLSPNALFPCPVRAGDRFREAYSWYFRDPHTGECLITPDFAAEALIRLIRQLGMEQANWTILGFSQGGFFAPHLIRQGLIARTIVTVGAAFRPEAYQGLPKLRVFAIHGEDDDIVPMKAAKASFEGIEKMGYGARFEALPGVGHRLDDRGRERVRELLGDEARA